MVSKSGNSKIDIVQERKGIKKGLGFDRLAGFTKLSHNFCAGETLDPLLKVNSD
jgi:hypothetical protein